MYLSLFSLRKYVIAVVAFSFIGCGGSGGGSQNNSDVNQNVPNDLDGTWVSSCRLVDGEYVTETISFSTSNNQVTGSESAWSTSDCSGTPHYTASLTGTAKVGDTVTTSGGVQARKIDIDFTFTDSDGSNESGTCHDLYYIDNGMLYFGQETNELNCENGPASRPESIDFSKSFTGPSGSNGGNGNGNGGSETENDLPAELNGTWATDCRLEGGEYIIESLTFNSADNSVNGSERAWSNSSCSGNPSYTASIVGSGSVGDEVTTSSGGTAREIDVDFAFTDSEGTQVSGTCYDLYQVDGNVLYLGRVTSQLDCESGPNSRPQDIDFSKAFNQ